MEDNLRAWRRIGKTEGLQKQSVQAKNILLRSLSDGRFKPLVLSDWGCWRGLGVESLLQSHRSGCQLGWRVDRKRFALVEARNGIHNTSLCQQQSRAIR